MLSTWVNNSFKKVICKVTDKEFEKAKTYGNFEIVTETSLDNQEVALVMNIHEEYPKFFKYLKLYK